MSSSDINKAYWIDVVKQHGSGGGINHLRDATGLGHAEVKSPIDFLTLSGYVEMKVNPSDKRKCTYVITSLGHSYLSEHSDELAAYVPPKKRQHESADTTTVVPATRHTVPDLGRPMQRIPTFSRRPAAPPEPIESPVTPEVSAPNAAMIPSAVHLPIVTPQTMERAEAQQAVLIDQIKQAAAPLLFDVYAGNLTLRQLVDFLEEGKIPQNE